MADLSAVNLVGESIVGLLRQRRSLMAASGTLGPVPASQDIAHIPVAKLASGSPPTSGLSLTCYQINRSDHSPARIAQSDPENSIGISLELSYLLACWSSTVVDELAMMSWAMLELNRYATLDQGQLLGGTSWERGETIQIAPEQASFEQLSRIWDGFKQKYRLSTLFRARVIRIGYGPADDGPPVVASRFGFEHGDPATEAAL
ncbi:MAG: DUF4255 domain-containing protein [Sphingorhabdus sp.]